MNICILTAKVLYHYKLLNHISPSISQIIICIPNTKRKQSYYKIKSIAKGLTSDYLFEVFAKNNPCIIEGYIYVKKRAKKMDYIKQNRVNKTLYLKIYKINRIF